jgi:alginate O-acetyltransferase complex protein AlgJ
MKTSSGQHLIRKIRNMALLLFFIVILSFPLYQLRYNLLPEVASGENRALATKPQLNLRTLGSFPKEYEKYFNDTFPFRNNLIQLHNIILVKFLQVSPVSGYVIGRNGWLFYKGEHKDLWGSKPYSDKELQYISSIISTHTTVLKESGIYYIRVMVPNKQTIYPEYAPFTTRKASETRLAQLTQYLRGYDDINTIDLRKPLLEAKKQYPVYYKTDTHWNAYGGFIAYQEIMKNIAKHFDVSPLSSNDFNVTAKQTATHADIAKGLLMQDEFVDTEVYMKLKEKPEDYPAIKGRKLSKLIIYHDSFMDPQYPWSSVQYLRNHFEKIISITNNHTFDLEYIKKEKPDVVIYEVVERGI